MPSPLESSPYEVLGVAATATPEELRRAFRRALRDTHPDTGGDPRRFAEVQLAWERVGTPQARAAYDAGRGVSTEERGFAARPTGDRRDTRPRARVHGHPGGWRRERYLAELRDWVGRGATIDDPYDPALVRDAPRAVRRILADALAEEATARQLAELGIGFTVWHDVAVDASDDKIDHIVLGPTGLWSLLSEDTGGEVRARRGELIGSGLDDARPVHDLAVRTKALARRWRVRFSGLLVVVPEDALDVPVLDLGAVKGLPARAVRQSVLVSVMRSGLGGPAIGGTVLFDVRERIQSSVHFA